MKGLWKAVRYSGIGIFLAGIFSTIVGCSTEDQLRALLIFLFLLLSGGEDMENGTTPTGPAAPVISTFVADDPDNGDMVYSSGDTLTIIFDQDTNQPAGTPTQLFTFNQSLGTTVNGSWTAADTYTITVLNPTGNGVTIGTTTATPTGAAGFEIRDSSDQSDPSSATSPALSGDFGI